MITDWETSSVGGSDTSGLICNSGGEIGCCWYESGMISGWATSSVICCRHRLQMASNRRKFKINIRQRKTIVLVRPNSITPPS